jgi:hypothetical protein
MDEAPERSAGRGRQVFRRYAARGGQPDALQRAHMSRSDLSPAVRRVLPLQAAAREWQRIARDERSRRTSAEDSRSVARPGNWRAAGLSAPALVCRQSVLADGPHTDGASPPGRTASRYGWSFRR